VQRWLKKLCVHCGKEFAYPPYLKKEEGTLREKKFCSKECCHAHRSGPLSPRWNGGLYFEDGYANLWINGERKRRNRHVMEEMLGRKLLPGEIVHHKNGIRSDDSPTNLELWYKGHPTGQRVSDKIEWAKTFLEQYGIATIDATPKNLEMKG